MSCSTTMDYSLFTNKLANNSIPLTIIVSVNTPTAGQPDQKENKPASRRYTEQSRKLTKQLYKASTLASLLSSYGCCFYNKNIKDMALGGCRRPSTTTHVLSVRRRDVIRNTYVPILRTSHNVNKCIRRWYIRMHGPYHNMGIGWFSRRHDCWRLPRIPPPSQ